MSMSAPRRRLPDQWPLVVALAAVAVTAGIAWFAHSTPPSHEGPAPTTVSIAGQGERLPINWDNPIAGTSVTSSDEAAAHVSFAPLVPTALGPPIKVIVDNGLRSHAGMTIAWVYQHPSYGRFVVIEGKASWTQASLEALVVCDPAKGCEGRRALVSMKTGANGLLVTGGPTTGIIWLWQGLTFDVYGPIDTFSVADAKAVADAI